MAKYFPAFINHGDTVLDFLPEANVSDISSSLSLVSTQFWNLDQTETHYILQVTIIMSCIWPNLCSKHLSSVRKWFLVAKECKDHESALLQEVHAFALDCFFNAESLHFTDAAKYVNTTRLEPAMPLLSFNLMPSSGRRH